MKKAVLIILLIGFMVSISFAQMGDMKFGLKSGMTLGKIKIDTEIPSSVDRKLRFSFAAGGMMIMSLGEKMAIQTELMYVKKGEKFSESGMEFESAMDVLELPVLFKYKVMEDVSIYAGMSFDYLMNSTFMFYNLDELDVVKKFGYGVSFGAQYMIDKLILDLRYDLGLTNYLDEAIIPDLGDKIKLNTIYFTMGYLF